ncbi:MAG: hypothetical protein SFT81_04905 [Candidatus Caenarcaniphilales bacterium]|nr:hypothetical protein [Candidatus Caenarcaniphilales bacterium]
MDINLMSFFFPQSTSAKSEASNQSGELKPKPSLVKDGFVPTLAISRQSQEAIKKLDPAQ